MIIDYMLSY